MISNRQKSSPKRDLNIQHFSAIMPERNAYKSASSSQQRERPAAIKQSSPPSRTAIALALTTLIFLNLHCLLSLVFYNNLMGNTKSTFYGSILLRGLVCGVPVYLQRWLTGERRVRLRIVFVWALTPGFFVHLDRKLGLY